LPVLAETAGCRARTGGTRRETSSSRDGGSSGRLAGAAAILALGSAAPSPKSFGDARRRPLCRPDTERCRWPVLAWQRPPALPHGGA
jgi:hypothetical protein